MFSAHLPVPLRPAALLVHIRCSLLVAFALALGGCAATQPPAEPPASEAAHEAAPSATPSAPLTLTPEAPQAGQPVTVSYYPGAEGARLSTPETVELVYRSEAPDYRIVEMQQQGARWTAQVRPDSSAKFLRLYVQSDSVKDQNGGAAGWGWVLHGPGGEPVRGAHVARAGFLREHYEGTAGEAERAAKMDAAYRAELAHFPDHLVAKTHRVGLRSAEEPEGAAEALRDSMASVLDAARQRYAGNAEKLREVQSAYYALVRRDEAQSVAATLAQVDPRGPEARLADFRRATAEGIRPADAQQRAEAFVERYPESFFVSGVYESLFRRHRDAGRLEEAVRAGRRWIETEHVNRARAHAEVALALSGMGRYDEALAEASHAVEAAPQAPQNYAFFQTERGWDWAPAPLTPAERRALARRQRGTQRAVLGRIHYRKRDFRAAAEVLAQAVEENPENADAWARLARAFDKIEQPERAYAAAEEALRLRPQQSSARRLFRRLYAARHGSEDGLQETVGRLGRGFFLEERIDRAAPDFELSPFARDSTEATAGRAVSAEALEGKVLVLDFWASWCGPCHQAFPHLQAVYEQYRDAEDVAFLVVNTSWNDTKARARQYIAEAGYTFPLYWDAGGDVAGTFGISSIPTTIIIGKGGRVQYYESGFGGPQRYEEGLSWRIDALRSLEEGAERPSPATPGR